MPPTPNGAVKARSASPERRPLRVAAATAALVGFAAAAFLWFEQNKLEQARLTQAEVYAKVLETHTSRELQSAAKLLTWMNVVLKVRQSLADKTEMQVVLFDALRDQPGVRSLSLLDEQGRVLVSSSPGTAGLVAVPTLLDALAKVEASVVVGPLLNGRDLKDMATPSALRTQETPVAAAGVAGVAGVAPDVLKALPMLLAHTAEGGQRQVLLALLDPARLASEHDRILDQPAWHSAVLTFQGALVSAGPKVRRNPGDEALALRAFSDFLPRTEQGSYVGTGIDGVKVLTAFRASRLWPLVIVVELDHAVLRYEFLRLAGGTAGVVMVIWLLLGATAISQFRGAQRRTVAKRDLEIRDEAVRVSEARKQAILQSALDAIVTVNSKGTVIDFNAAAERMFGRSAAQAIGQPMHEMMVPHHHRAAHHAGMARYLKTRVPHVLNRRVEVEGLRADGSLFPVELTIVPVQTTEGEIFTATLRDITERLRVGRELQAREEERTQLLERISTALTGMENQRLALDQHAIVSIANAQGVITYANSKLLQVSGYSQAEIVGQKHSLMLPGPLGVLSQPVAWRSHGPVPLGSEIVDSIAHNKVWVGELLHQRKDGSTFWAASTVVPMINASGELEEVFCIQTDVTERIRAEQALAAARDAELQMGGRIQQALLVTAPDQRLPNTWVSSVAQASKGIDGDFVEVLTLGEHCVDIVLGDVMGKGVSAALIGAAAKMQLGHCVAELMARRAYSGDLPQPHEVVTALHRAMAPNLLTLEAFITLIYLRINVRDDTITWVGCGHEESVIVRVNGGHELLPNQHPPIGVLDRMDYEQQTLRLFEGDAVFVCSDGVTDAVRSDGQRVGQQAVVDKVMHLQQSHRTPAAVLHALKRDLLGQDVRLTDDMTMLMAVRTGDTALTSRRELQWQLTEIDHVRGLVQHRALEAGLEETAASLYTLACVEAFTNVVRHSTGIEPGSPVELVVRVQPGELSTEFIYLADAFEPPAVQAQASFEGYPEGGFGMTIMEKATDRVDYERSNGVNLVRLLRLVPP